MGWAYGGNVGEEECVCRLLEGPLGRPRCRWVDKIKMDLVEIG
jgi:hypothetical protein